MTFQVLHCHLLFCLPFFSSLTPQISKHPAQWLYFFRFLALPNDINSLASSPKIISFAWPLQQSLLSPHHSYIVQKVLSWVFLPGWLNFLLDDAISVSLEQTLHDCSSCEVCLQIPRLPPCPPWDGASGHTYLPCALQHHTECGSCSQLAVGTGQAKPNHQSKSGSLCPYKNGFLLANKLI